MEIDNSNTDLTEILSNEQQSIMKPYHQNKIHLVRKIDSQKIVQKSNPTASQTSNMNSIKNHSFNDGYKSKFKITQNSQYSNQYN